MSKTYVPSPDYLTSMYCSPNFRGRWTVVRKVPITSIQVNELLFSFQNKINPDEVERIKKEFVIDAWYPIMVNPQNFLLDGQHRLAAAKKMGMKFIDIVIDYGDAKT